MDSRENNAEMDNDRSDDNVCQSESETTQCGNTHVRNDGNQQADTTDDGVDSLISEHHEALTSRLRKEGQSLEEHHFKDYSQLSSLRSTIKHLSQHLQYNSNFMTNMTHGLKVAKQELDSLNKTIKDKIETENLKSWLNEPLEKQDVGKQAESRELMAEGARIREEVAQVHVLLAETTQTAAQLQQETIDAQQNAVAARQQAAEAEHLAEIARAAAEEKTRKEKEARHREEDRARKEAEEEQRRRDEEVQRKAELERLKGTPEELERIKREQERVNPDNWPIYNFMEEESTDFDSHFNCVLRVLPGLLNQDDIEVKRISQIEAQLPLTENDELISSVIKITPYGHVETTPESEDEVDAEVDHCSDASSHLNNEMKAEEFEVPLSLLMPHCAPRSTSREAVVMWRPLHSTEWITLDAKDCNVEGISREVKFVESRPNGLGVFAVVFRFKWERMTLTKRGGKVTSSVDSRVVISCRPGAFRVNTSFSTQLQPVDLMSVTDVRQRYPETCADLIASSPMVRLDFTNRTLNRPISISVPVPANTSKAKRPVTAVDKDARKPSTRPASAFGLGSYNSEPEAVEDSLHLLIMSSEGRWIVTNEETVTANKKGDLVTLETNEVPDRLWFLRVRTGLSPMKVAAIATQVHEYLSQRLVQFIMRQKADDPTDICLVCTNVYKQDKIMRRLDDEDYTENEQLSNEYFLTEGQVVTLRFRGNLQPDEDVSMSLIFNSHLQTQQILFVAEVDRYAQKGFNSYRGFAQFYIAGLVKQEIYEEGRKGDQRKPIRIDMVPGLVLLAELLICLPKPDPQAPKPLKKAPITFMSEGPIDERLLRNLATDLGDEWKILASHLHIKKMRIQSIMRNHVNDDDEQAIFEMLITWAKRIPRSLDKVEILCSALQHVGRNDLVEDIRDREYDFKEQRAEVIKDNLMKRVFVKVAQNSSAMTQWKELGNLLGVPGTEILNIENDCAGARDRCLQTLNKWKESNTTSVTVQAVTKALKTLKLLDLAGEIRNMTSG